MANLTSTLAIRLLDGISGPAKGAAASLGAITKATEALGKVKGLREQTAKLDEMTRAHQKAREGVRNLAGQLLAAEAPSRKMQAAYERATQAADRLGVKLEWQRARVRGAADALSAIGIVAGSAASAEARLRQQIDTTTAAIQRQERAARRHAAAAGIIGGATAGLGMRAAGAGRNLAVRAVEDAAALDIAQRKQTAFAGISAEAQARILAPQAKRIAFDTQFSTLDVTKAQTATMAGLPEHLDKAGVARSLVEQAKNVAMALGSNMEEAAESLRGYLAARAADMSTAEAAERSARSAANRMIRAAKLGGMSAEDVAQFTKYGGASARAAGISEDNTLALGIALRRAGVRGDEAGVAVRSFAGKLVAPTAKGRAAMLAAGIDHDRFTTMPGGLSTDNLSKTMAAQLGIKLNEATRAAIEAIHDDAETVTDRGKYAAAVAAAIGENGGKMLSTKDSEAIARAATQFHKLSVESVDVNRLLEALMAANLTLSQANAIFTDKQGGRAALALGNSANFASDKKALAETPEDYGAKIAAEIMSGLGGSLERFKGAVEATILSIGEANSGLARFALDGVGSALDAFSNMSTTSRQAATAIGALAAAGTTAYGAFRLFGAARALLGGGSAAALSGSALALDGSAAALTAAAVKLGGAGVAGAAGAAATGAGAGAGAAGAAGGILGGVTVAGLAGAAAVAAGIATIIADHKPAAAGVTKATAAPGQEHDEHLRRRRAATEAARQRILQTRREIETIDGAGIDAGTDAGRAIPEAISSGITANGPKVEAAARGVLDRIRALFGAGVDVPVRVMPSGVPASPAAPSSALPAPNRQSSLAPSIRNNVTINTGSGDPREIAAAVSRAVGEKTAESLRGAFSDNPAG
jgi:hypothetical protein